VQRFISASAAIKAAKPSDRVLQKEAESGGASVSLSALMAMAKAKPATMAYYRKAGLSEADAVLIPVAIADAELVMGVPAAAKEYPTSPAHMAYVKTHAAQIQAFSKSGE
jgi:hypothetical protein